MSPWPHPIIAREGWPYLAATVIASAVVAWFFGWWSSPLWLAAIFVLQFFRDPPREVPQGEGLVLCPADGRVIVVGNARDPYRNARRAEDQRVHERLQRPLEPLPGRRRREGDRVQRGPLRERVLRQGLERQRAQRLVLRRPATAPQLTCVQVAGLIARRILCYAKVGDSLARGQRYGFIRFGSRVDVYLPPGSKPRVAIGDKVKATSTVLAELPAPTGADRAPRLASARAASHSSRSASAASTCCPTPSRRCNLFAGFYAIVQGMNHEFEKAAIAIFVAMVLDSLDGRVARLTHTQSAFGAEFDSLTDMVSFGAAPALRHVRVGAARHRSHRMDRRVRLLRRCGVAPRALQHAALGGRQALVHGPAEPRGGRARRGHDLGLQRLSGAGRRREDGSPRGSPSTPGSRWSRA